MSVKAAFIKLPKAYSDLSQLSTSQWQIGYLKVEKLKDRANALWLLIESVEPQPAVIFMAVIFWRSLYIITLSISLHITSPSFNTKYLLPTWYIELSAVKFLTKISCEHIQKDFYWCKNVLIRSLNTINVKGSDYFYCDI